MENTDQAEPEPVCREFGVEVILWRDQETVVACVVLPRILQRKNTLHRSITPNEESGTLFRIRPLYMRVDLLKQVMGDRQRHFASHRDLSLRYL